MPHRPDVGPDALRAAIESGEIALHFQPLIHIRSGRVVAFEVLARWSPRGSGVSPSAFIPLAERSRLITPLTLSVVRGALAAVGGWRANGREVHVSVNLSLSALAERRIIDELPRSLEAANADPSWLAFEITETHLMADTDQTVRDLAALRAVGVRLSVDDFGTGYSSLSYLGDLPIDEVKIDRSFIARMVTDRRSEAIVRATIGLSHELGFEVVGEGVEDIAAWNLLAALGCDLAQGYHVARPMPESDVTAWMDAWDAGIDFIAAARRQGQMPTPPELTTRDPVPSQPPILVVDDEPAILAIVRDVLEQAGFAVVTAASGAEALEELERAWPRLVLLDMNMPKLDGEGFARAVHERGRRLPIVVMTAGPSAERWAKRLSADGYLAKPFDISHLLEVTERFATANGVN